MIQPKFTWWPWRFLAIAAPLLALGGAAMANSELRPQQEVYGIFFSVLAAANGYMFAMAVGDFGRSILAIPIGAAAGYAAVFVFSFPLPNTVFVIFLFIVALLSVATRMMKLFSGCLMMIFLFFAFVAFVEAFYRQSSRTAEPGMCVFSAYPFVCGCVAAALPIENTILGIFQAGLAGVRSAMYGMVLGTVFTIALGFLMLIVRGGVSPRTEQVIASIALSGFVAAINYFCVQNIFTAVHRAGGDDKLDPFAQTEALTEPDTIANHNDEAKPK